MNRTFGLAPDVRLTVDATAQAARHFAAEYGPGPIDGAAPVMRLRVGRTARETSCRPQATHAFFGGHRLARWRVRVQLEPDATSVRCGLQTVGPLALPLAQSMVVEPLLSLVTPAAGRVLLPGALVGATDGPVLVLGPSGTGKSTLALRALAAGRLAAADDQVLVAREGACAGLSRRLRVYGDLPSVVPAAHALLPVAVRRRVALAGVAARVTGGRVAPPVLVSPTKLDPHGSQPGRDMWPVRALILLAGRSRAPVSADELLGCALALVAEQRQRLTAAGVSAPAATLDRETAILRTALGRLDAERIDLRRATDPLAALEQRVGT